MNKTKILRIWILISGITISLIGLAHSAMTPMIYRQVLKDAVMCEKAAGFAYFFALGGVAFILAGVLSIYASFGIERSERWTGPVIVICSLFISLSAISAIVFAGFGNPLIYIMGTAAVLNLVLIWAL